MAMEWLWALRIIIALAGTGAAAYYDMFNRKNVPDRLLYAFLGVSLAINIIDPAAFIENLPVAAVIIASLYALYRIGQIGGADVFVLAAIYAALPAMAQPQPSDMLYGSAVAFQLPSILIVISVAVMLFAVWLVLRYAPDALRRTFRGEVRFGLAQLAQAAIIVVSNGLFTIMFAQLPMFSIATVVMMELLFLTALFFVLYKDMMTESMVTWTRNVSVEDVLALEAIDARLLRKHSIGRLVDEAQLKRMRKLKRKWPVLDLPMFLPFIFVALVITILYGGQLFGGML